MERAVLRLPLHCGSPTTRGFIRYAKNGQSYDCPSIAAVGRVWWWRTGGENGQSYDCPSIAACTCTTRTAGVGKERAVLRLPLHCGLRPSMDTKLFRRNGQSYDCPSIAAVQNANERAVESGNGQSYDCPSIAALGDIMLVVAPVANGQSYDCPSIAASLRSPGRTRHRRNGQSYDCPSIAAARPSRICTPL